MRVNIVRNSEATYLYLPTLQIGRHGNASKNISKFNEYSV